MVCSLLTSHHTSPRKNGSRADMQGGRDVALPRRWSNAQGLVSGEQMRLGCQKMVVSLHASCCFVCTKLRLWIQVLRITKLASRCDSTLQSLQMRYTSDTESVQGDNIDSDNINCRKIHSQGDVMGGHSAVC